MANIVLMLVTFFDFRIESGASRRKLQVSSKVGAIASANIKFSY